VHGCDSRRPSCAEVKVFAASLEAEERSDDSGGVEEGRSRKQGLAQDPADRKGRADSPCPSSRALVQSESNKGEPAVAKIAPATREVAGHRGLPRRMTPVGFRE
jgi:hypothetical protein